MHEKTPRDAVQAKPAIITAILFLGLAALTFGVLASVQVAFAVSDNATDDGNNTNSTDQVRAKVKAFQDGSLIDADGGIEGSLGADVDCVGAVETDANADSMKCYLIPADSENVFASQFANDSSVILQEGSSTACPESEFEGTKECFSTTFNASNFNTQGDYRFVAQFYSGDELVDTVAQDYRLHSFFVLPESAIGALGIVGSSLAAWGGYTFFKGRKTA